MVSYTGKTTALALTVLRIIQAVHASGRRNFLVCITALSWKAIDVFLDKVRSSINKFKSITGLQHTEWLDDLSDNVWSLQYSAVKEKTKTNLCIVGGTVYKLPKLKATIDLLIVDEASQLGIAEFANVFNSLARDARVVVAGDPMQLCPILRNAYAPSPVSGSLLSFLLRDKYNNCLYDEMDAMVIKAKAVHLVSLTSNYRMTNALCKFSQNVYGSDYQIQESGAQDTERRPWPSGTSPFVSHDMITVMMTKPCTDQRDELAQESNVVSRIISDILRNSPNSRDSIKVIVPHRNQRDSLRNARTGIDNSCIDTVDRMQGSEADIVIVCYGFRLRERIASERAFLYNRSRINVAITRAKVKAIVLLSEEMLDPHYDVISDVRLRDGYLHLDAWHNSCSASGIVVYDK